jgi:Tannase and feruloyl esterase
LKAALLIAVVLPAFAPARASTCESLLKLTLPDTTIVVAESRLPGDFTPPGGRPLRNLPAFCRIAGRITPSTDSDIRFEVWLPATGWNGKFQGVGNGGFAGTVGYAGLADAVTHSYASASTDTGHAETVNTSAAWALRHPEKVTDFGYRAIHLTAANAKAIVGAFYGEPPRRSYFNSCSNGGRQALMEAQRFPADYDGILAGAPANYWTHLLATAAAGVRATLSEPASYISAAKLPAIQAAALAACDATDGVRDGVIENPLQCRFDPSVLLCKGPETDACLTVPQLAAAKAIYGGLRDSKGKAVFPGLSPGGESEPGGWAPWITGDAPEKSAMFAFSTQFFRNIVFASPDWDFRTFDVDRDTKAADDKAARDLNATEPDLGAFEKRGGKLILYHGWADAAIPPVNAINYYRSVMDRMGAGDANSFIRLYMVPGMEHCGGGAGPNSFGQTGTPHSDRSHDIDAALETWVEEGIAPNRIIATRYKTGADPVSGILRTRPLCPYPQIAKWKGTGSTDDAANFVCARSAE